MRYPTQQELLELSEDDRLQLLEDVWETFQRSPDSLPLSDGHKQIIDMRLGALERDPEDSSDWEEARARIMKD